MSDLRLQVYQGHASLREEMSANQEKVQNKIAATETELRREMIVGFAEMRKFVEQKFFWLLSAYFSTLVIVDRLFKTTFTRGLSYGPSKGLSKNDRVKKTQGAYG